MPRRAHGPKTHEELVAMAVQQLDAEGSEKTRVARARKVFLGCVDCGYRRHPEALQFDHRPGEVKIGNISGWEGDLESMMREMEKCDVVCANCHAIRTSIRRTDAEAVSARGFRLSRREGSQRPRSDLA